MATQYANRIISMMDSREKALRLIKSITDNMAKKRNSGAEVDATLILEDLSAAAACLDQRIKRDTEVLTGKDAETTKAIKKAARSDYVARRLKARAILMRVHQKVQHSLLAAVPYRRRVSRAKKGAFQRHSLLMLRG